MKQLLENELKTLTKICHPAIVDVKQLLEDDEKYYIASEICEGGQLFERIMKVNNFCEHDAADIIE